MVAPEVAMAEPRAEPRAVATVVEPGVARVGTAAVPAVMAVQLDG